MSRLTTMFYVVPLPLLSKRFCYCNLKYRKPALLRYMYAAYALLFIVITYKVYHSERLHSSVVKGIYNGNNRVVIKHII